jgi:hypothetical protein
MSIRGFSNPTVKFGFIGCLAGNPIAARSKLNAVNACHLAGTLPLSARLIDD